MIQGGDHDFVEARPPRRLDLRLTRDRIFEASWFWAGVGILASFGIWSVISGFHLASSFVLPPPWLVLQDMYVLHGALLQATWETTFVCLIGFACGLAVGVALALAMHYSPSFSRAVKPTLVMSQTIPILALAPILVLWFGFTITPKLIVVSLLVFFPIALNMADGLRSTAPELRSFAESLGASRLRVLWYYELPSSLPQLFTGIRIAATYTVIAAVIAEWVGGSAGLGALMTRANFAFETETVFGSVLMMIALGISFYVAALGIERLVIPWHIKRRDPMKRSGWEARVTGPSSATAPRDQHGFEQETEATSATK